MVEGENGIKVSDRRFFNENGELREEASKASEKPAQETANVSSEADAPTPQQEPERPMDFKTLVFSFTTTAMVQLGILANPATGKAEKDLHAAKQTIDVLEILSLKTKGNLDAEESQLLEASLYDLKMSFLQATNQIKI
jgi:hypothetical protein